MSTRRTLLTATAAGLAGVVLGVASAWWQIRPAAGFGQGAGPWRVSLLAGSADADATTRARVAIGGLLALNRAETMYYVARTDSAGQRLRSRCRYRIEGVPPAARWWSVTAYAEDYFLFADDAGRYGINGSTAGLDAQGRFRVHTGPRAPAEPGAAWLPTPGDRGLLLTLRVYNPASTLQAAPASLVPPTITLEGGC
jgi:hypothetical protein